MKSCLGLLTIVLSTSLTSGAELSALIREAESASMPQYKEVRDVIVAQGKSALPVLDGLCVDTNSSWKTRLVVGICAERIRRNAEVKEMASRDWTKDPEYQAKWERYCGGIGTSPQFAALMVKRYKEKSLDYYYIEIVWKATGEYSTQPHLPPVYWMCLSEEPLRGSPQLDLFARVLEEQISQDLGFRRFETWGKFHFLIDNKIRSSLPFILEILPKTPVREKESLIFRMIRDGAVDPGDAQLVEKYYAVKGENVPLSVANGLKELRLRANPSSATSK